MSLCRLSNPSAFTQSYFNHFFQYLRHKPVIISPSLSILSINFFLILLPFLFFSCSFQLFLFDHCYSNLSYNAFLLSGFFISDFWHTMIRILSFLFIRILSINYLSQELYFRCDKIYNSHA